MPLELFLALVVFACVMAFTPGPNNVLLAASGVNFGFMRTMPHMLGVTIGFDVLLVAGAIGVGLLFAAVPALHTVLKVAGAAYMLWLAWKVANAHHSGGEGQVAATPFTFMQAAAFQWINPKAVIAVVGAVALYVRPDHALVDFPIMVAVMTVATIGAVATWTGFGVGLRRLLRDPARARIFNISMALLLVLSIVPMVLE
jgi:threonine/homoserine/homoserine lactone efflux protein